MTPLITGQELYRTVQQIEQGLQTIPLNINQLPRGTYILRVQCGEVDVIVDSRNFIKL